MHAFGFRCVYLWNQLAYTKDHFTISPNTDWASARLIFFLPALQLSFHREILILWECFSALPQSMDSTLTSLHPIVWRVPVCCLATLCHLDGCLLKRASSSLPVHIPLFVYFSYSSEGRQFIQSHICTFSLSCFMDNLIYETQILHWHERCVIICSK